MNTAFAFSLFSFVLFQQIAANKDRGAETSVVSLRSRITEACEVTTSVFPCLGAQCSRRDGISLAWCESNEVTYAHYGDLMDIDNYLQVVDGIYRVLFNNVRIASDLFLTPPVALAGVCCNILSIAVLSRDDSMPTTTSILLQTLAAADLLNIVFSIPLTSLREITDNTYVNFVKPWLLLVCTPLQSTAFTASVWVQVLVTVERYVAVCYPMHVSRVVSLPRMRSAIIVVWLLAAAFNVCRGFEVELYYFSFSKADNRNSSCFFCSGELIHDQGLQYNVAYQISYISILYPVITLFLPITLLLYFTVRILWELEKSFKEQLALISADEKKRKEVSSKQRRTTVTLVSIVIVFLCSQILMFYHFIYTVKTFQIVRYITWFNFVLRKRIDSSLLSVAYLILSLQSILNFFIYCVSGQRYRQAVNEACACSK